MYANNGRTEQPASVTFNRMRPPSFRRQGADMSTVCCKVAGIEVHKRILAVVIIDSADATNECASVTFGTTHRDLTELRIFLAEHQVTHAAMESTAQYWRPVWLALEGDFEPVLTQARATRARRGRKPDMEDASGRSQS